MHSSVLSDGPNVLHETEIQLTNLLTKYSAFFLNLFAVVFPHGSIIDYNKMWIGFRIIIIMNLIYSLFQDTLHHIIKTFD